MTRQLLALSLALAAGGAGAAEPTPMRGEAAPAAPRLSPATPAPARGTPRTSTPGDVKATRHNLSVTGRGEVRATQETRVCFFCHGSHMGTGVSNRPDNVPVLQGYSSAGMRSRKGAASNGTRMCISCHDGSLAVGQTVQGRVAMRSELANRKAGLDLRRSHPVGVQPVQSLSLRRPGPEEAVRLDRRGSVECTSCHDPHREDADPGRKFLVASNQQSALCLSCHALSGWGGGPSSHRLSQKLLVGGAVRGQTIADAACASCHVSHGAAERGPLLRAVPGAGADDALCLSCHDGRTGKNIAAELVKASAHAAERYGPVHDAAEGERGSVRPLPETGAGTPRHVTCVDCHEPHAANGQAQPAPLAQGALAGSWGVDRNGQRVAAVRYEYEVCFKCHADSANRPQARGLKPPGDPQRRKPDDNLRQVFDLSAVSFHPVAGPGKGNDVPSLIRPLTTGSVIRCSDCHGSDAAGGPRGPHGSIYPKLLVAENATRDGTVESPGAYALCYRCHDQKVLMADPVAPPQSVQTPFRWTNAANRSESLHTRHVRGSATPCSACHNPHGVSALVGTRRNNAHLVDFDTSIVKATAAGQLEYLTDAAGTGSCALSCHGKEHGHDLKYGPNASAALRALLQKSASPFRGPAAPAPSRGGKK